jgi:hypothetical protein
MTRSAVTLRSEVSMICYHDRDSGAEEVANALLSDGARASKKGKEINTWYSGKAHHSAGNVQALVVPGGVRLWVSDIFPAASMT